MAARRPFYSIVIPCYNDGRYGENNYLDAVLENIVDQKLKKFQVEVIISDDHSPQPYQQILDKYADKLILKYVETDYNCCPGNTRQKGADIASGKWLCFVDHDDRMYPNTLADVKKFIEDNSAKHVVFSDFNKVDPIGNVMETFTEPKLDSWVHGKFYNLDNFWKKYNIHFNKDLKTHEDIALGNRVRSVINANNIKVDYFNKPTYLWIYDANSLSHSTYVDSKDANGVNRPFLDSHFKDYIDSGLGVILDCYQETSANKEDSMIRAIQQLSSIYLNFCIIRRDNPGTYNRENLTYIRDIWTRFTYLFKVDVAYMKVLMQTSLKNILVALNDSAQQLVIPTFFEFLAEISSNEVKEEAVKDDRPFFSLIIPCYNDGRYKEGMYLDRLLSGVTRQGIRRDELEVILSDDCSPTPFVNDIKAKYDDKLIIKYVKTDYNCCPGNTRAKGVEIATGRWLCFADHDDIYYDNALAKVKNAIAEKGEQRFIFGNFYGVSPEGEIVRKFECTLNWCHAKFYNKDNFWDKYNIHFIKDLKSHEDIAICTQVSCALAAGKHNYTYMNSYLYAWTDNPQSVSHAKYTVETETGPREFLEVFYDDYIHATGYTYLEKFNEHTITIEYAIKSMFEIICYAYFYSQGFQFRRPDDFYKNNLEVAGKYVTLCKETFNTTNDKIYEVVASNKAYMYREVKKLADVGSGPYIPTQTFRQWLDLVSPEN